MLTFNWKWSIGMVLSSMFVRGMNQNPTNCFSHTHTNIAYLSFLLKMLNR